MSEENERGQHSDDAEQAAEAQEPVSSAAAGDVWDEVTEDVTEDVPDSDAAAEQPEEPEQPEEAEPEEPAEPRLRAIPGEKEDDPAKEFISSVEGFFGDVFREASEAFDKLSERARGRDDDRRPPAADPSEFMESVESWVGDFFRGGPVTKAAAGFGKAAASQAFKSSARKDDVWASATSERSGYDASRECRYCPFCQTLAAVRSTRPELYDQIGDTAKRLVDLVKQAADQSRGRGR